MVKMTDIDLPLSDIINKKKITLNRNKATSNAPAAPKMATAAKPKIIRPASDARNHLIQKKRLQLTDARDQLAKIAKTSDARDKLNKIRSKPGQQQGGIPELMKELQSKPTDMRQKLNLQRNGALQVKKNYSNVQQAKPALQTAKKAGVGTTRMQGNALVRTVSGNSGPIATAPPRRTIQNVGGVQNRGIINTIQNRSGGQLRGLANNSINIQRKRIANKGISGSVIQQFHRNNAVRVARQPVTAPTVVTVRNSTPGTQVVRGARTLQRLARRTVPVASSGAVYATRPRQATVVQPQTVYRQVPARMPSYRTSTVVVQERPQPPVVYEEEPAVLYEEEPLEYDEYDMMPAEPQPVYYDEGDDVAPAYEPEYEEVYVPRVAPAQQQQQHYGPPIPPQSRSAVYTQSGGSYVSRTQPRLQQQQQQVSYAVQPQQQYRTQPQQRFTQQQQQPRYTQQQQQPRYTQQQQQPRYTQQQRSQPQQRSVQMSPRRPVAVRAAPMSTTPKVVGHRVVVSNLHPVATNEDIEELFGNIGTISSCKMTRPGTASVVFINLSDAQKSVEVYHNRKLDGQPMQVKIVGTVTESNSMGASSRSVRGRVY